MALYRSNNGGTSEVSLWTNDTPTADFAAQDVTISEDMDSFKALRFVFQRDKTHTNTVLVDYNVEEFKAISSSATDDFVNAISPAVANGGYSYVRRFAYASDTTIHFEAAYRINSSGNSTSEVIPVEIIGIK